MMGALVENLLGVVIGEATGQGQGQVHRNNTAGRAGTRQGQRQQQWDSNTQQQQHQRPSASLAESITDLGNRILHATLKGVQYLLLLEALLLSAGVLYGGLYWLIMPLRLHDKPLFFDYGNKDMGGPTATVDFLAQHAQWTPSQLTNVERFQGRVLKPGQHYEVGLELSMPTSPINRNVGVFMIHTTLFDAEDNDLATSDRPAMLPHTSGALKGLRLFFTWPLFLVSLKVEADTVYVSCMDFYEENALHPLTKARVTISSNLVQFYRASVNVTPQLKGLPWLMHDWFYSTLAAGVLFIASLELMICGFCYVFFFIGVEEETTNQSATAPAVATASSLSSSTYVGGGNADPNVTATPVSSDIYVSSGTAGGSAVGSDGGGTGVRRRITGGGASGGAVRTIGGRGRGRDNIPGSFRRDNASISSCSRTQTVPQGVQAYRRGADFVIASGSVSAGRERGAWGMVQGGGNAARAGESLLQASPEEQNAAALASWAALGVVQTDSAAGSSTSITDSRIARFNVVPTDSGVRSEAQQAQDGGDHDGLSPGSDGDVAHAAPGPGVIIDVDGHGTEDGGEGVAAADGSAANRESPTPNGRGDMNSDNW